MIVEEILVLIGLIVGSGYGLSHLFIRSRRQRAENARMMDELRVALRSHDFQQLDDWLLLWGNKCDEVMREIVQGRRDDLYLKVNE